MAESKNAQLCVLCGAKLSLKNTWVLSKKISEEGKLVPYCQDCQQKMFIALAATIGYKLSMFFSCANFNLPYLPEFFAEAKSNGKDGIWIGYINTLRKHGYVDKKLGFADGVIDIKKAFSKDCRELEVDDKMLDDADYRMGAKFHEKTWGKGSASDPYTESDYEILDRTYKALTDERPYRNAQVELAIQRICKWTLEQDKCMRAKEYADAQRIGQLIKTEMESEQLRKKDELPQDVVRLDDITLAVERAGLHIMDKDELLTELANHSFHKKYPYTRDAADQMLLLIRNTTAWNEGQPEVAYLPQEQRFDDRLDEFAKDPDDAERQIYDDLQLQRFDGR